MNNRIKIIIVVLVVAIIGVVAAVSYGTMNTSENNQAADTSNATETDSVTIKGFAYEPSVITVKKGTTVTWTNQDQVGHTVTSASSSPMSFGSELFGKGETYSYTFDEAGTYDYYCKPHPYMKGTVVVTE